MVGIGSGVGGEVVLVLYDDVGEEELTFPSDGSLWQAK